MRKLLALCLVVLGIAAVVPAVAPAAPCSSSTSCID